MEKLILCCCLALAFASCSENLTPLPPGFVEQTVCLTDSFYKKNLAMVRLAVPAEIDTLLVWIHHNDDGGHQKYRFTNKKWCLIQETGQFYYDFCKDSTQRLTIAHEQLRNSSEILDSVFVNQYVRSETYSNRIFGGQLVWKKHQIEKIGSQDYAVFHYKGSRVSVSRDSSIMVERILAITEVGNVEISFCWECAGIQDCTEFIQKAFTTLASIQIDTTCR